MMDDNARLQQSFDAIKTEADIKTFVTNKTKEGLYLEFKQKSNSKHGKLDNDDKKNFSKALSGFANSDGGILVWGVQARAKDESAKALKPINQVDNFIRSLKSFLTSATQPIVDGVLIEKVQKEKSNASYLRASKLRIDPILIENTTKGALRGFTDLSILILRTCLGGEHVQF